MNTALLTIDDAASKNTPALVDYLTEKGIPAIFFAVGENVEKHYDEALYAVKKGFLLGNHSHTHPAFSSLSLENCIQDIEKCETVLNRLYHDAGMERLYRPFRFPYGDKGGINKASLQQYLKSQHFHKVDDTHLPYAWWKENQLDQDVDTFWTFDFEEYRLWQEKDFSLEHIRAKTQDSHPSTGDVLYGENQRHFILMHDFEETNTVLPRYYEILLDELLQNGIQFEKPRFLPR